MRSQPFVDQNPWPRKQSRWRQRRAMLEVDRQSRWRRCRAISIAQR